MIKMKSMLIAFSILIPLIVGAAGSALSDPNQSDCEALEGYVENLTDETFGMPITNVTATWRQVETTDTYFCQVTG